ncbi:Nuclear transcription factor Y subunit A-3 [Dictyocoela muelleri]|nr:Nuclear transcription factor Y subunit A-3 [Dictyocoela muelleri]
MDKENKLNRFGNRMGTPPEMYKDELQYGNDNFKDTYENIDQKTQSNDKFLNNGLIKDGLIENGLIKDGLIENGLIENGLIKDGLIENDLIENGLIKDDLTENDLSNYGLIENGLTNKDYISNDDACKIQELHLKNYTSGILNSDFQGYIQNDKKYPELEIESLSDNFDEKSMSNAVNFHISNDDISLEPEFSRQNMIQHDFIRHKLLQKEMQESLNRNNRINEKDISSGLNISHENIKQWNIQSDPSIARNNFIYQELDKYYPMYDQPFDHKHLDNDGVIYDPTSITSTPTVNGNIPNNLELYKNRYYQDSHSHPIFVNVNQYDCIKKRKLRREFLDSIMETRTGYLHESRHRHAMNRLRAPSGRFLTKEEMMELKKNENNEQDKNN